MKMTKNKPLNVRISDIKLDINKPISPPFRKVIEKYFNYQLKKEIYDKCTQKYR